MKVLHVIDGFHTGGIEQLALQLLRQAPPALELGLLNLDSSGQDFRAPFEQLGQERGLRTMDWPRSDGPALAVRSFRLCRRWKPDALLIFPCKRPLLWVALGARLAGVRRMAIHIGNPAPADPPGRCLWQRLLRWFQRLGVVAVPCSEAIVDSLRPLPRGLRLGPVIPNGCDTGAISSAAAAARARRPAGDPCRVLMVARLDPIKDQATLMRAFAAARQSGWQLMLVGDGPDRPALEALALELGLDPATLLPGRRLDIPALLGQADLFAFSTTAAEGFGIALIEALAAGLPVLASDVPACREVLRDGAAGELLPPGDVRAWQQRLEALMTSLPQRTALGASARAHADVYDISHTARRWYASLEP